MSVNYGEKWPEDHAFVHFIREKQYRRVVEVGVFGGTLTNRVVGLAVREGWALEKYYMVDPWKPYINYYNREPRPEEKTQEWWDAIYNKAMTVKDSYPDIVEVMRMESVEASDKSAWAEQKFDAVYIDSIHDEENIVKDLYGWLPLINKGGMILGHDYSKSYLDLCEALEVIFEDKLILMIRDISKPAYSYKNTHQGGNWWVHIRNKKQIGFWMKKIEDNYSKHLEVFK
jgi:hypothetical protein